MTVTNELARQLWEAGLNDYQVAHRLGISHRQAGELRRHLGIPPKGKRRGTCLHCKEEKTIQSRGLCDRCFNRHRSQYPVADRRRPHNYRGPTAGFQRDPPPPDKPTNLLPWEGKSEVLAARAAAGRGLWHPDDATAANQMAALPDSDEDD